MITAYEDYYAVGADEPLEERPLDAPVDPYADIDPELLGGMNQRERREGCKGEEDEGGKRKRALAWRGFGVLVRKGVLA